MDQEQIFVLNQKLLSFTSDMWIEDAQGNRAFLIQGRAFSIHQTHYLMDLQGNPLYEISQALAHLHQTFEIKRGAQVVASVQKALVNFMGDRFTITLANGEQLQMTGNWIDREFHVSENGRDVILTSRQWFSLRDTYGVQIAPGFDVPLGLAIVVALERMEWEERNRR